MGEWRERMQNLSIYDMRVFKRRVRLQLDCTRNWWSAGTMQVCHISCGQGPQMR